MLNNISTKGKFIMKTGSKLKSKATFFPLLLKRGFDNKRKTSKHAFFANDDV